MAFFGFFGDKNKGSVSLLPEKDKAIYDFLNTLHQSISSTIMVFQGSKDELDAKSLNEQNNKLRGDVEQARNYLIKLGIVDARYLTIPLIVATNSNLQDALAKNLNALTHLNSQVSLLIHDIEDNQRAKLIKSMNEAKATNDNQAPKYNNKAA